MAQGTSSLRSSEKAIYKCTIPMKLPSLNDYIRVCRANKYEAAAYKRQIENDIGLFVSRLPILRPPVNIHFHWVEGNKKRDLDNACFGKKFILDSLVKHGRLENDNRKCVESFTDTFEYGEEFKVILYIEEV